MWPFFICGERGSERQVDGKKWRSFLEGGGRELEGLKHQPSQLGGRERRPSFKASILMSRAPQEGGDSSALTSKRWTPVVYEPSCSACALASYRANSFDGGAHGNRRGGEGRVGEASSGQPPKIAIRRETEKKRTAKVSILHGVEGQRRDGASTQAGN